MLRQLRWRPRRCYARNLDVPSGSGVCSAHTYGAFAAGGRELGLRQETLNLVAEPAIRPTRGFYDECMKSTASSSRSGS